MGNAEAPEEDALIIVNSVKPGPRESKVRHSNDIGSEHGVVRGEDEMSSSPHSIRPRRYSDNTVTISPDSKEGSYLLPIVA